MQEIMLCNNIFHILLPDKLHTLTTIGKTSILELLRATYRVIECKQGCVCLEFFTMSKHTHHEVCPSASREVSKQDHIYAATKT